MPNMTRDEIRFFRTQIHVYRDKARRQREDKELQEILAEMWEEEWDSAFEQDPTLLLDCPPTKRSR